MSLPPEDYRLTRQLEANARVQQWRAQYDSILLSDRAAVDVGLVALRSAILINSGSIVIFLAFAGQIWDKDRATAILVVDSLPWFVWGLVAGAAATLATYIYQSLVTLSDWRVLYRISSESESETGERSRLVTLIAGSIMMVIGIASLILFIIGAFQMVDRLSSAKIEAPRIIEQVPPVGAAPAMPDPASNSPGRQP